MKKNLSTKLKATFLLLVFGMNILAGVACAAGVDMNFNARHHQEKVKAKVHVHPDGKKHTHHSEKRSDKTAKDDCCNDSVVKISKADKAIPQSVLLLSPALLTIFTSKFFNSAISCVSQGYTSSKYFVRGNHPPITDIRIAIRSFQI